MSTNVIVPLERDFSAVEQYLPGVRMLDGGDWYGGPLTRDIAEFCPTVDTARDADRYVSNALARPALDPAAAR